MQYKFYDDFILSNSLIPIQQLENSPFKPAGFVLAPLQSQIQASGLSPDDFYFNPGGRELPFCYYHSMIYLDFPAIDNKIDEIKALISRLEQDLKESVAKRDFDRFLSLVDPRLAPDLFMEVFNFVPDQDKHRLFEHLWCFNKYSRAVFTQEFIKKAAMYKGVTSTRPAADEDGYVKVYLGQGAAEFSLENASSWTLDVNVAILYALRFNPSPDIYQGRVHLSHIIAYDNNRSKKELQVKPCQVEQLEVMDLINLHNFKTELEAAGILQQYNSYSQQIADQWFNNPGGVHALSHTKRVLFLSLGISYLEEYGEEDRNILCLASLYHDIGRTTDGYDPNHGIASYEKLIKDNLIKITCNEEHEILRFLIHNHAIPDQSACQKLNRYDFVDIDRALRLYDAFKDADGLDRVRLGDLNPEYLRTKSAHRLLLAAHQLYQQPQYLSDDPREI